MPARDVAPLITEEKYSVCKKRVFQTITGGIKWLGYNIPWFVVTSQILLWILPLVVAVPFVLLAEFFSDEKFYFAIGYGVVMGLLVAGLEMLPLTCRNQSLVVMFQQDDDEDSIDFSGGCWRKELNNFIFASRKWYMLLLHPFLSATLSGSMFVPLLPESLNDVFPLAVVIILLPLVWLTLLIANYSFTVHPPTTEPAVYTTTTPAWLSVITRPSHVIIAASLYYILKYWADVPSLYIQLFYIGFCLLPLDWILGVVPPPEALIFWTLERLLVILLGGSAMATDFRILVMVVLSVLSVLLVAVIGDSTSAVCIAAVCGLLLSQDLFTSFNMLIITLTEKTKIPLLDHFSLAGIKDTCFTAGIFNKTYFLKSTRSIVIFFLSATVRNVVFIIVTLCICIVLHSELNGSKDASIVLGYLLVGTLVVFQLALHCRQLYILRLVKNPLLYYIKLADDVMKLKQCRDLLITILSIVNVLLHKGLSVIMLAYLSVVIECGEDSCSKTWPRIVLAVTTVRSLRKIWQHPTDALAGIVVAFLLQRVSNTWDDLSIGLQLLIADILVEIAMDFWQKMNFSVLLFGAFLALEKYRKHEYVVVTLTVVLLPFVLATIVWAAAFSAPLLPLFTLPVFLVSFPRPKRMWPSRLAYNRTCSSNSNTVYYQQALPVLASSLQQTFTSGCIIPRAGDQILFRFQDRIVWASILEVGSTFFTVTFQGLELQETSCHTVEAAKLDTLFESSVSPAMFNPLPFHTLQHIETAAITCYSDAKNVMTGIIDQPDNLNRLSDRLIKCLIWVVLEFYISGEYKKVAALSHNETERTLSKSVYPSHQSVKASVSTSKPQSIQTRATGAVHHRLSKGFSRDSLPYPTISAVLTEASDSIDETTQLEDEMWSPLPGLIAPDKPVDTMSWESSSVFNHHQSETALSVAATTALPVSSAYGHTNNVPTRLSPAAHQMCCDTAPCFPAHWAATPLPSSQLNKLLGKFPHDWLRHVRKALGENGTTSDENRKLVEHANFCDHFAKLIVTCHSILEGVNACTSPMQVYHSFRGIYQWSKNIDWITLDPVLNTLVLKAYRYAVKLMYDEACLGEASDFSEIVEYLESYDNSSFIGCEDEESWKQAVLQEVPNLFSLGYDSSNGTFTARVLTLQEQTVFIGSLNPEAARAFWSALNMELIYLTNDDDERYSIQAHPYLLRNITIQAAQPPLGYPIYCSGPVSISF